MTKKKCFSLDNVKTIKQWHWCTLFTKQPVLITLKLCMKLGWGTTKRMYTLKNVHQLTNDPSTFFNEPFFVVAFFYQPDEMMMKKNYARLDVQKKENKKARCTKFHVFSCTCISTYIFSVLHHR